jgi:hypothetical protein
LLHDVLSPDDMVRHVNMPQFLDPLLPLTVIY